MVNCTIKWAILLTLSKKLRICFSICSVGISQMAWTYSGSISIPLWLTIRPSNFPELAPKTHSLGFSLNLYLTRCLNNFLNSTKWCLAMHHIMEQGYHGSLIGSTDILQVEWHDIICVGSPMSGECSLGFVLLCHLNLVVAWESIHEGEEPICSDIMDQGINVWLWKVILGAGPIQIPIINAHAYFPIFLRYRNDVVDLNKWTEMCVLNCYRQGIWIK